MNKLTLIGHVGSIRYNTPEGHDPVLEFTIAVNESRPSGNGERTEETTWFTCQLWGERATKLHTSVKQGSYLYVEGKALVEAYLTNDKKPAAKLVCRVAPAPYGLRFLGSSPKKDEAPAPEPKKSE
jgi:single stranded DNA-binding protein